MTSVSFRYFASAPTHYWTTVHNSRLGVNILGGRCDHADGNAKMQLSQSLHSDDADALYAFLDQICRFPVFRTQRFYCTKAYPPAKPPMPSVSMDL